MSYVSESRFFNQPLLGPRLVSQCYVLNVDAVFLSLPRGTDRRTDRLTDTSMPRRVRGRQQSDRTQRGNNIMDGGNQRGVKCGGIN
ncbi:hypothetical protein E2C01_018112 [Portunus trituberculatus]|uniref:Uncharacterized protein n=1 Tax=Portunus trituberculatus TaxID=210409 RepID=A0A5B7DVX2_PORTR|nr:hypothetical protein [Portunus trituberculatus]